MSQENNPGPKVDLPSEDYRAAILRIINEEIASGRLQNGGSQHLTNRLVEELAPFLEPGASEEPIPEEITPD